MISFISQVIDHESLIDQPFLADLISSHLTQKLFRTVRDINHISISAEDFPSLPGSHLNMHNAALEFIKMV